MDTVGDVIRMPPRGHYLAWEAGQLAGVSGNAIGQWGRRGYIHASQSEAVPKVYSYQDSCGHKRPRWIAKVVRC